MNRLSKQGEHNERIEQYCVCANGDNERVCCPHAKFNLSRCYETKLVCLFPIAPSRAVATAVRSPAQSVPTVVRSMSVLPVQVSCMYIYIYIYSCLYHYTHMSFTYMLVYPVLLSILEVYHPKMQNVESRRGRSSRL
jgi:hypothetical protein